MDKAFQDRQVKKIVTLCVTGDSLDVYTSGNLSGQEDAKGDSRYVGKAFYFSCAQYCNHVLCM